MKLRAAFILAGLAIVVARPLPSHAACHRAVFKDTSVTVREHDVRAQLVIELEGEAPTCSGTVRYETVDDTATAPADYTAREGEVSFTVDDDREAVITVPIVDDQLDERRERFEVRLTGSTGTITQVSDTPAVVTIRDDDEPAEPSQEPTPSASESPVDPTAEPTGDGSPTGTPAESPSAEGSPSPTETLMLEPAAGGSGGLIAGALAALAAAGGAIWWFLIRKRSS